MTEKIPGRIIVKTDLDEDVEIQGAICSLFWSDGLRKEFEKDPDKTYSASDLSKLMGKVACTEANIRNLMRFQVRFFDRVDHGELRLTSNGGMRVFEVAKLQPVVKYIFRKIKEIKEEMSK